MRMIHGSLSAAKATQVDACLFAEKEKQNVTRMMAALGGYPWEAEGLRVLTGPSGNGALGIQAGSADPAEALLPQTGNITIAADARLDNRPELCAALDVRGNEQVPLVDAELILLAYRRWGTDCAARLLGDFAFALWDEPNRRLFCARDFIGVRPFYYHYNPGSGRFVFAGDLLAMAAHPYVPLELNLAYFAAALKTGMGQFQHPEHTYYQAIEKLPPAHCLTWDASPTFSAGTGGLRRWAYWRPGQAPERTYAGEREYAEELRSLLQDAVACRVTDPRPIGAHISGGLDSSSMAVLAHRILHGRGRSITGFSWAPPLPMDPAELPPNDERNLVEAVRQAEGFPVRYTRLTPEHVLAHARRDITLQPTTTLQFELAAGYDAAGLGIRTMLSGWGGDEFAAFNGRGYFSDLLRRGRWLTLQRELAQRSRIHGGGAIWKSWIASGLFPLLPTALLRRLQPGSFSAPSPLPACLRPAFAASLSDVELLARPKARERPGVRRMQISLLHHGHLSYRMESWSGFGASLGITYAYPLLDRRLVEFSLSIPDHLYFKNGWKRYLYRTAMDGILPESLRWNKKKEDPAMVEGSRRVQAEAIEMRLADLAARADNPYVDVEKLRSMIAAQARRDAPGGHEGTPREKLVNWRRQRDTERGLWPAYISRKKRL